MQAAFVPKNRRPKFELTIRIIDLNNVPLVNGHSYVKWHLPTSTAGEHRGRTSKCRIADHRVDYSYVKKVPVRLTMDKSNMLQEMLIDFEVVQEYASGSRGERITLGWVKINLAEYIEASEASTPGRLGVGDATRDDDEGVVRRYLMQESKINSTVKIGIHMRQLEGDKNYIAPPLKTAQVFSGIAGIINNEHGDAEDDNTGTTPSLSTNPTHTTREASELADMYRRTLAAYWAAQPGELKADDCIEDIFAGGDGWGDRNQPYDSGAGHDRSNTRTPQTGSRTPNTAEEQSSPSENERRNQKSHRRSVSNPFARSPERRLRPNSRDEGNDGRSRPGLLPSHMRNTSGGSTGGGVHGRASLEQQTSQLQADVDRRRQKQVHEVDELMVREDLRSWSLAT